MSNILKLSHRCKVIRDEDIVYKQLFEYSDINLFETMLDEYMEFCNLYPEAEFIEVLDYKDGIITMPYYDVPIFGRVKSKITQWSLLEYSKQLNTTLQCLLDYSISKNKMYIHNDLTPYNALWLSSNKFKWIDPESFTLNNTFKYSLMANFHNHVAVLIDQCSNV